MLTSPHWSTHTSSRYASIRTAGRTSRSATAWAAGRRRHSSPPTATSLAAAPSSIDIGSLTCCGECPQCSPKGLTPTRCVARARRPKLGDMAPMEQLIEVATSAFDVQHGGFGGAPKFPHAAPVKLALRLFKEEGSQTQRDDRDHDPRRDGMGSAVRREGWRLLPLRAERRLGRTEQREAARRQRLAARPLPRRRRVARAGTVSGAGRGHPALRADVARRSGRRRMGRFAARRQQLSLDRGRRRSAG